MSAYLFFSVRLKYCSR